jgi:hypothetical protein
MHRNPNKPHRTPLPQHKARRGGRQAVPYQREPWTPPGWLLGALCAAALLLALVATIVR